MKKMSEKTTWGDALSDLKKFNPFVLFLLFGLIYVSGFILNSALPLDQKAIPYVLSVALVFITVTFEIYRIEREKELQNQIWR
jgi:hypothetical protein